jgi:ornithine carbamoyltransferase
MVDLGLKGRSFLTLHDYSPSEIEGLLDLAAELKAKQQARDAHQLLPGRVLGMIFQKTSTRTRVSFEVGMYQLGGHAMFLSSSDIQLKLGETLKDTANVLSRFVDAIMIRTFAQQDVIDLATYGQVPVINGLTDDFHPCQALSDCLTIREHCGSLKGKRLVYVGDGNNVAHSLMIAGAKTGMHVTVCTPIGYGPQEWVVEWARADAEETGAKITLAIEPAEAVAGADVIYTDTWASMGQEKEHDVRVKAMRGYQVNMALVGAAGPQVKIMHCLPAHWGEEITEEALYSPYSVVFDQAENRMHAQKAIMAALID